MTGLGGPAFGILLTAIAGVIATRLVWPRWRQKPNRDDGFPERVKLPRYTAPMGWLLVAGGAGASIATLLWTQSSDRWGLVVASALIWGPGLWIVAAAHRWYLIVRQDHLIMRSVFGKPRILRYEDISTHKIRFYRGTRNLLIRDRRGRRFWINPDAFDLGPLTRAIERHERTDQWPRSAAIVPPPADSTPPSGGAR